MSHNFEALKEHILPLSASQDFSACCLEWSLQSIEISEEWDHCPCGKDIKEHCHIHNRITGARTYVGNVCINRFMGFDTKPLFAGLKRIESDWEAAPNEALIAHAARSGYLYGSEPEFLLRTARKRILSDKQLAWRTKINRRIISQTIVTRRGDAKPPPLDW